MLTVGSIRSAADAARYVLEVDDYLREGETAPTQWLGAGAQHLALSGAVDSERLTRILNGWIPGEPTPLGRHGSDGWEHRAGYELTFSAPKAVSVAALAHGDHRLLLAHDQAVAEAVRWMEQRSAAYQIHDAAGVHIEASDNLIAAAYRHHTSREIEPQIHSHVLIANATQDASGRWRSIESRALFVLQMEGGEVYRAALAERVAALGYRVKAQDAGGKPSFRIVEVSEAEEDFFSTRRKQVDQWLVERGKTRATATAAEKEAAALATRQRKPEGLDHAALRRDWAEQSRALTHRMAVPPVPRPTDEHDRMTAAREALIEVIAHLSERDAVFTHDELVRTARQHVIAAGIGTASLDRATAQLETEGVLASRQVRGFDGRQRHKVEQAGYTTADAVETERRMLQVATSKRRVVPLCDTPTANRIIAAQERASGWAFNEDQRRVATDVMRSPARVQLVQGLAGTAKTSSVLACTAQALRQQGYQVKALAPTHAAANVLGHAIGAEAETIARHLSRRTDANADRVAYIVDEASMISAQDMATLMERSRNNRIVLVGDVAQLASVGAGRAFAQLQEAMPAQTHVLETIVRQRDEHLRAAVYAALDGNARAALANVVVREHTDSGTRQQALVDAYVGMSAEQRMKTLVLVQGREERTALNRAIREQLQRRGEIAAHGVRVQALESKALTKMQTRRVSNYQPGDILVAGRDYHSLGQRGVGKGDHVEVIAIDYTQGRLNVRDRSGGLFEIDPRRQTKFAAHGVEVIELSVGDRMMTRGRIGTLDAGAQLQVITIDGQNVHARDQRGRLHVIDGTRAAPLAHAYAQTTHQAQGRTCAEVLALQDSRRMNLTNQQGFYVALSRATERATVFTDDRRELAAQIGQETGQKQQAMEPVPAPDGSEATHPHVSTSVRAVYEFDL